MTQVDSMINTHHSKIMVQLLRSRSLLHYMNIADSHSNRVIDEVKWHHRKRSKQTIAYYG